MPQLADLSADPSQPGLWVNRKWTPGTPGLFAVVIGVSRYDYLLGAAAPATETYGLGQLAVSALTAWTFFDWLRNDYYVAGCPLAKCWMLISPTTDELAFAPALAKHSTRAEFNNCKRALGFWHQELKQLPPGAAQDSRSLFFFSGHGIEVHQDQQILLTSDWMQPPNGNENEALSTQNVRAALASLGVPRQFYFVDACRNDHQRLRQKVVSGTKVLTEDPSAQSNPNLIAPVLYATSSGQQAWQQPSPGQGLSLYGQALLDGLQGRPNVQLDCQGALCSVNLFPLQIFVEARVAAQLAAANSRYNQPVPLGGTARNETLTFLQGPSGGPPIAGVPTAPAATAAAPPRFEAARQLERLDARAADRSIAVPVTGLAQGWVSDSEEGHRLFARESVTDLWQNRMRVVGIASRQRLAVGDVQIHHVRQFRSGTGLRIDLSILGEDPVGFWIEWQDFGGSRAAVLPTDREKSLRYTIDLDSTPQGVAGDQLVISLDAALAKGNVGLAGAAASIWRRYQAADLAGAVSEIERILPKLKEGEIESPLAATVAALVLLRASRNDLLKGWLEDIAGTFTKLPDLPVLAAEQLVRDSRNPSDTLRALVGSLHAMELRGLPLTAEGLAYAATHVDRLVDRPDFQEVEAEPAYRHAAERVRQALSYFQPGGLFVTFGNLSQGMEPWELIGPSNARQPLAG